MNRDPYNKDDISSVEQERRDQEELRDLQIRNRFEWLMSSKEGREVVEIILSWTGVNSPAFSTNALTMANLEGKRDIGLKLMSVIEPSSYLLMLKEINERRTNKRG